MGGMIQLLFYLFLNIYFTLFNMIISQIFSNMRFSQRERLYLFWPRLYLFWPEPLPMLSLYG